MRRRTFLATSLASLAAASCNRTPNLSSDVAAATSDTPLKIWWEEGFYPEEISALKSIISQWKTASGAQAELTVIPQKDILQELDSALRSGETPDLFYAGGGDLTIVPKLAWDNLLADVSEVVTPRKDRYSQMALAGVSYQNKTTDQRGYYAVPLMQSAIHIHYWEDLLVNLVGERRDTLPKDWENFWQLWLDAQQVIDSAGTNGLSSVGMPMSLSLDTYNNFEQFLEAYNVTVLDDSGRLNLSQPDVRAGLIAAMTDYARFFQQGTVPAEAVDWDNTGNNVSLLSRQSLMTVNHTLSAPGSQRNDKGIYYDRLSTIKWPDKPNGDPMRFVIEIKQAAVFEASENKPAAISFLSFLSRPENLASYTKGAQGRYLPAMPDLFADPFWNDPKDKHISVAVEQLENTRPAYQALNPAYGEVAAQNVWGKAMRKIAVENAPVEQAADAAIADIEAIFTAWQ